MKKLMISAVMVAIATAGFAQDALKQAKSLVEEGKLNEAAEAAKPAFTTGETADRAAAYNEFSKMCWDYYVKNQGIKTENEVKKTDTPYDQDGMNRAVSMSYEAALECDKIESQPNEKGKVKIKFRGDNAKQWMAARVNLINSGQYWYNHKNMEQAVKDWKHYVDGADQSLFTGMDMTQDPYKSEICYYIGLASYNMKNYDEAKKYAKLAAQDPKKVDDANEIILFATKDACKTKEDSIQYLAVIKDLHKQKPTEQRYFNLLLDYYSKPGRQAEMKTWAEEEVAADPTNKMAWAIKGEVDMNNQHWDDAIASFRKAAEIDPTFVQVIFNAGVCFNSKAIDLQDKLTDKSGKISSENLAKVKEVLAEARKDLEKARELDPNREKVNWAYPLYRIYYNLGDKQKAAEMEALLGSN